MKFKVLFLSHDPHPVHTAFADSVGARYYQTQLKKFVACTKTVRWTGHFYAPYSFLYSLFIRVKEDVVLIDGGASLYVALGLKLRNWRLKLMYLDGDTMFYSLHQAKSYQKYLAYKLLTLLDAVISVSDLNQSYVTIAVPKAVCVPFPAAVQSANIQRQQYGLYVGRLDPDKKVMEVITFALQCPIFEKFVVVGDGVLRPEIEKLAATNPKLQYEGWQKDVAYYYSQCSFLIHLPDHDPHPTVTMEAALCGCFPIMSPGTGSKYLFDPVFTASDPADFTALNDKITYISHNQTRMRALLRDSLAKVPTRESSIAHFLQSFDVLLKQIKL